jgi:feruloyl esterase
MPTPMPFSSLNHPLRPFILAFVCAVSLLLGPHAAAAATCDALATSVKLPHTSITSAALVEAGAFTPAAPAAGARAPRFDDLPAFCRIAAVSRPTPQSQIGIEIWLPAANWNGKFQATGWAFWGGAINPAPLATVLRQGYATATTDGGHQDGNNASFAVGHGEKFVDWSERAWHETTIAAKAAIAAFYGKTPTLSYWNACGGGTRQGLMEIQQYPADYDAIAAGGLSNDTPRFTFTQSWMYDVTHKDPASYIPASKFPLLNKAALAACDATDGATDGLIADPRSCRFDPAVLTCKGGDGPDCLTGAQVASAQAIYAPVVNPRTKAVISGGMMPGSELGWNAAAAERQQGFNIDFFRYFVFQDPTWDPKTRPLDYDSDVARASVPALQRLGATEPDISAFLDRGGKLLMYAGWNDTAIPTAVSTGYYESVVKAVGAARARAGVRLFMIPGMGHCPAAAMAADGMVFDALPVLEAWKERGEAPATITVRRRSGGADAGSLVVRPYTPAP